MSRYRGGKIGAWLKGDYTRPPAEIPEGFNLNDYESDILAEGGEEDLLRITDPLDKGDFLVLKDCRWCQREDGRENTNIVAWGMRYSYDPVSGWLTLQGQCERHTNRSVSGDWGADALRRLGDRP